MKTPKPWRPLTVLFVGDEPSSKNVDPTIPFVGTPSYKRLLRWIGELDLCLDKVSIINSSMLPDKGYDFVFYLGENALNKHSKNFESLVLFGFWSKGVRVIDHPSPRNRKFNDPDYEKKMLQELKTWLYT